MPDVVLPVLDEAGAVPGVLAAMPPGFAPIVVDNGSTDGSGRIARELGATVVREERRGFGAACAAGLAAARSEVVCFMDCDGSLDPGDLVAVSAPVEAGDLDLCFGARRAERGSWPVHARFANRALAFELRRRAGVRVRDVGPMRAARRKDLLGLGIADRRFGWPLEMVLLAARDGWRIGEREVAYRPRIGRSKVTGTVRGTARAVADMTRVLRAGDSPTKGRIGAVPRPKPGSTDPSERFGSGSWRRHPGPRRRRDRWIKAKSGPRAEQGPV